MSMVIIVLVPFSGVMIPLMIISGMILEKGKLTKVLLIAFLLIAGGLFLCMAGWGISRFLRSPQSQLELIVGLIIFIKPLTCIELLQNPLKTRLSEL